MRPRAVHVRRFPASRRLVIGALRAGRRSAPMHGLLDLDVTDARRSCPPLSFTAFVVCCAARAAAAHPEVHAYRDWRGRIVTHDHVDVGTLVEIDGPDGPLPLAHLVRDADIRTVTDVSAELRAIKAVPAASRSERLLRRLGPVGFRVPGAVAAFYWLLARSTRMRRLAGTVSVTSVGMFGAGGGFGIAPPVSITLGLVVGGISPRPRAVDGSVEIRDVLDLTVTIDHALVDGAPAARFAADLRRLIESAELLRGQPQPART
jgi:pyruvate/2-oxoglutarate dehydrogenase complex dihydrolipoamide acyltransferase (E2) component